MRIRWRCTNWRYIARSASCSARSWDESSIDALGVVLGQIVAGKIDDVLAVDYGPDESIELRVPAVGALEGRGQSQPKGGDAGLGGKSVRSARQVVAFVENDEAEACP